MGHPGGAQERNLNSKIDSEIISQQISVECLSLDEPTQGEYIVSENRGM